MICSSQISAEESYVFSYTKRGIQEGLAPLALWRTDGAWPVGLRNLWLHNNRACNDLGRLVAVGFQKCVDLLRGNVNGVGQRTGSSVIAV